ncbi:hypothetical protein TNCV_4706671 [Trichonephila clavipes]|nr:hypothetical protein TNCV_4706671 [Trichonephila clavipes]
MLNKVGERSAPCGAPALICFVEECVSLTLTAKDLLVRKDLMIRISWGESVNFNELVEQARMPYTIKGLLDVQKNGPGAFFLFESRRHIQLPRATGAMWIVEASIRAVRRLVFC